MERSTIFLMGKLTISMAMFNSYVSLPEGNLLQFATLKMAIEIVSFPMKNGGDFPVRYVKLPEGKYGGFLKMEGVHKKWMCFFSGKIPLTLICN